MTSIEQLNKKLEDCKIEVIKSERIYRDSIMVAKSFESLVRDARKERNKHYKIWVQWRKRQKYLKTKISSLPSRMRKWGKDNPGKLLNSLGR